MAEVSVFDVAKHFLSLDSMDHKKLQKLCYYSQCWAYGLNDKMELMDTDFEAWIHGPVSPSLYHHYKVDGWKDIPQEESPADLIPEIKDFLDSVYKLYGKFSGDQLEALTHSEKPWLNARGNLEPIEPCNNVISYDDMYIFCKEMLQESEK